MSDDPGLSFASIAWWPCELESPFLHKTGGYGPWKTVGRVNVKMFKSAVSLDLHHHSRDCGSGSPESSSRGYKQRIHGPKSLKCHHLWSIPDNWWLPHSYTWIPLWCPTQTPRSVLWACPPELLSALLKSPCSCPPLPLFTVTTLPPALGTKARHMVDT